MPKDFSAWWRQHESGNWSEEIRRLACRVWSGAVDECEGLCNEQQLKVDDGPDKGCQVASICADEIHDLREP